MSHKSTLPGSTDYGLAVMLCFVSCVLSIHATTSIVWCSDILSADGKSRSRITLRATEICAGCKSSLYRGVSSLEGTSGTQEALSRRRLTHERSPLHFRSSSRQCDFATVAAALPCGCGGCVGSS